MFNRETAPCDICNGDMPIDIQHVLKVDIEDMYPPTQVRLHICGDCLDNVLERGIPLPRTQEE